MIPSLRPLRAKILLPVPLRAFSSFQLLFLLFIAVATGCNSSSADKIAKQKLSPALIVLPAPVPLSAAEKAKLNRACTLWYDSMLKNKNFNGGMLVAKHGDIIFERYQGANPPGSKDSITGKTPFHVASVSKTFTAMAVLKLMEMGKLQLDDSFSKYFPSFNYPGVSIRNLMSHRSGLPNYLYFLHDLGWNEKTPASNQDIFDLLVNRKAELEDISPPGTHYTYCNTNYVLLALLVEKLTGSSFPAFVKEQFLDRLQMTNSFIYTPADSARATPNYDGRGPIANSYMDNVYGDKNAYTTPRDLLIWDRALSSKLLLTDSSLQLAYTPYSNERPGIKNYGLGWHLNTFPNGKKIIFHNGWWHGNTAAFVRLPDEDVVIIVLGNRSTKTVWKAIRMANSFGDYFDVPEPEE